MIRRLDLDPLRRWLLAARRPLAPAVGLALFLLVAVSTSARAGERVAEAVDVPVGAGGVVDAGDAGGGGGGGTPAGVHFFREQAFVRGDANSDGAIDIADATAIFSFLFLGSAGPSCENAADTNHDATIDLSDGSFLLNWLFLGGPEPPAPGPFECGVDSSDRHLPCAAYDPCPDDLPLIAHVLNRITFGPTEELLTRIQTRADLVDYIEEQLAPPEAYDQQLDEPALFAFNQALEVGFNPNGPTPQGQSARLKSMLLADAAASRWQLFHRVAVFWNNHFHTQIGTLVNNVFGRGPIGGAAARSNAQQFAAADADASGAITEAEWLAFRVDHPGVVEFAEFRRVNQTDPSQLTLDEYLALDNVSYWKYRAGRDQLGIAADMERREYDAFRRYGFGRFLDLAEMHTKSVAQVIYLNNYENTVLAPNENAAREFFELYMLGADHVYTQRDIEELAKVFTGWSLGWHERSIYAPDDILRVRHPDAPIFAINLREPQPFQFANPAFWDDDLYTWGFHFGHPVRGSTDGHDWGRKDIFLAQYGGVDSLGNPLPPSAAVRIAANTATRTTTAAMAEFALVLDRTVSQRDCAKYISTKLIQLFVTDDLGALAKTQAMPADLVAFFDAADLDRDGEIEPSEWAEPTPDLPNGRPPAIFASLDLDDDGGISRLEYQEPDLLLDAIAAWRRSGGEIGAVLRAILLSDEFLSLKFYRAKVKDPFELFASALRGLDARPTSNQFGVAAEDLRRAGLEMFDFADPTGESELGFDWMHTVGLLERLKYVNRVANPATAADTRAVWNPGSFRTRWALSDAAKSVDFFTLLLAGGDVLDEHRELAEIAYADAPATNDARLRAAVAYLLSLPQFEKQ